MFIDETGIKPGMTRTHGRAPKGERVHGSVSGKRFQNVTVLGAIGLNGVKEAMSVKSGTTREVFKAFLEKVLLPGLHSESVLVMDNLSSHKVKEVKALVEKANCKILFLPPYSPEKNPIELAWSKLKTGLRSIAAETHEKLEEALTQAFHTITPENIAAWFQHCGYAQST